MTIFLNFLVYLENFPASNIDINDTLSSEYFTIFLAFLLYWLRFQHHKIVINCLHQVFVTSIGMLLKQRDRQREKERDPSKYLCICVSVCICMYVYSHICMKCWRNYFFLVSLNTLSTMDVELNWALLEDIFWYNPFIFIICIYYVNRFLAKPS